MISFQHQFVLILNKLFSPIQLKLLWWRTALWPKLADHASHLEYLW